MRHADKLIEAVKARPFLYDQTLQTFKHIGMKNHNWMEVAQIVYGREDKAAVHKVRIQWKSLRDAFVKQQRKRQCSNYKVRPYVYENEMQFLLPHILMREKDDFNPDSDSVPLANLDLVKTEDSQTSLHASLSGDSQTETDMVKAETPVFGKPIWDQHKNLLAEKDAHPVDAFFHGIAQTVKQLKPATVAKLKKAVANIVMDAEIEELEKSGA